MKYIFFLIISLSLSKAYGKEDEYALTSEHSQAYQLITSLQFEKGDLLIKTIKNNHPENLFIYHIENYRDVIELLISEDALLYEELQKNKDFRLEKLKSGNENNPYFLFSQAEVLIHWAMVSLKFGEYYNAAFELNKALGMLEKNKTLFPDFLLNNKSLSFIHAAIGTIPNFYKNLLSLFTKFSGTIEQGLSEIDALLEKTSPESNLFYSEAIAIKALMLIHFKNDKVAAWHLLRNANFDYLENPLHNFLFAITANHIGNNDLAIEILEGRIRSPRFQYFPHLDYLLGNAKLYRMDADAEVYLKAYTTNFNGNSYVKDAYKKLAWAQLIIHDDLNAYSYYIQQSIIQGSDRIEVDKAAFSEAKNNQIPNKFLLKSRLLFDGGYFEAAADEITKIDPQKLTSSEWMEFYYRNGRIQQALENQVSAIAYYQQCLSHELSESSYFACNAALQLGYIYEATDPLLSESFFRKCLALNPSEYKNSLHQKAKAGLQRLKR